MRKFDGAARRVVMVALGLSGLAGAASATATFFNSDSVSGNAATRTSWLSAIGISAPDLIEDFESIQLDTNVSGVGGLLAGGMVVTDRSSAGAAYVRGPGYYGGSNPVGTRSLAHNEQNSLELYFGPSGVNYVGGLDIDHTAGTVVVTYADNSTSTHTLETTIGSGNSAEFWGFYSNGGPFITKLNFDIGGDGAWGVDNIEFSAPVPEPATMGLAALGLMAATRRRFGRRTRQS